MPSDVGPLAALGVISASTARGETRRAAARETWLRLQTEAIVTRFVLRCGNLSSKRRAQLEAPDVVCSDIDANEGRTRGPILALAWWLRYTLLSFPTVAFIFAQLRQLRNRVFSQTSVGVIKRSVN